MGMLEFYGPGDEQESIATIHQALELGVTPLDTADMYGPFTSEELVGKAIGGRRDEVVLATKFGLVRDPADPSARRLSGRAEYVRRACAASLRRLGVDHIDLAHGRAPRSRGASTGLRALAAVHGCPPGNRLPGRPSGHDRDRLDTPVTAGAFVIESEPGPGPAAGELPYGSARRR